MEIKISHNIVPNNEDSVRNPAKAEGPTGPNTNRPYNWFFTLVMNHKDKPIADIFNVLRYINKTKGITLASSYLLEVKETTGQLHIHILASVPNRQTIMRDSSRNIKRRLKRFYPGYYLHINPVKDTQHIFNILNYDKKTNDEFAREYILNGYNAGYFNNCPYHTGCTCSDFTINEAYSYYWYVPLQEGKLKY